MKINLRFFFITTYCIGFLFALSACTTTESKSSAPVVVDDGTRKPQKQRQELLPENKIDEIEFWLGSQGAPGWNFSAAKDGK